MKLTLRAEDAYDALANVLPHAETNGTLPAIAVVRVEVAEGAVKFVATDRYTLAVADLTAEKPADDGVFSIPVDAVKDVVKMAKAAKHGFLTFTISDDGDRITVDAPGESRTFLSEVGEFPKWRSLWPADDAHAAHEAIGLGASHLAKFAKLQSHGRHNRTATLKFTFGETPNKPVLVTVNGIDNFRALVMPVRLAEVSR